MSSFNERLNEIIEGIYWRFDTYKNQGRIGEDGNRLKYSERDCFKFAVDELLHDYELLKTQEGEADAD